MKTDGQGAPRIDSILGLRRGDRTGIGINSTLSGYHIPGLSDLVRWLDLIPTAVDRAKESRDLCVDVKRPMACNARVSCNFCCSSIQIIRTWRARIQRECMAMWEKPTRRLHQAYLRVLKEHGHRGFIQSIPQSVCTHSQSVRLGREHGINTGKHHLCRTVSELSSESLP